MISLYSFLLLVKTRLVVHGSFGGQSILYFDSRASRADSFSLLDIGGMLYGKYMRWAILFSIVLSQVSTFACFSFSFPSNLT